MSVELLPPPTERPREHTPRAAPAAPSISRFVESVVDQHVAVARIARVSRARRFGQWLNRPRRVLLALFAVWVVCVFDFYFTLSEWGQAHFIEMNPLAVYLLSKSPHLVAWFKFGLLGLGTVILLALRRHRVAEYACWFLLAAEVYLAVRWFAYYESLSSGEANPMIWAG